MKTFLLILLFLPFFNQAAVYHAAQEFNRIDFYHILKSGTSDEIDKELSVIDNSLLKDKEAYKGALLMKRASVLMMPTEKLDNFKKGAKKLEAAIHTDSSNVEYRFLRLMIQEHTPKILKYSSRITEDAALIKKNYKQLAPDVQKILIDYSQTSKALKPEDFPS
jgi:hypothetical protein